MFLVVNTPTCVKMCLFVIRCILSIKFPFEYLIFKYKRVFKNLFLPDKFEILRLIDTKFIEWYRIIVKINKKQNVIGIRSFAVFTTSVFLNNFLENFVSYRGTHGGFRLI